MSAGLVGSPARPRPRRALGDLNVDDGKFRVMSFGGGRQTTALLFAAPRRYRHGGVILGDTGDEHPGTLEYIRDYVRPFCDANGLRFAVARNPKYESILAEVADTKFLSSPHHRQCTNHYKVRPVMRQMREWGATAANPCIQDLGISADESHRINTEPPAKYVIKDFPLAYNGITLADCIAWLGDAGYPIPPKSACDHCFFQSKKSYIRWVRANPERAGIIAEAERRSKKPYANGVWVRSIQAMGSMDAYLATAGEGDAGTDGMGCESGSCWT